MSSSRAMRRSRMPSPVDLPMRDAITPKKEVLSQKEQGFLDEWVEPPLRAPAPSFEDYKGLERQGVLEHMAPLGTLPTQKVKQRMKQHEGPRRLTQLKHGEATTVKDRTKTPDPALPVTTRRSEPRKTADHIAEAPSSQDRDDDHDYKPKGAPKKASAKPTPSHIVPQNTNPTRTPSSIARLRQVVDSAVERSHEIGNPALGLAVKRLFEESLNNRTLAELLDAVLSQKPTKRQAEDFQGYIKIARKQIKTEKRSNRHSSSGLHSSSQSLSLSPSKSIRLRITSQNRTALDRGHAPEANHTPLHSLPPPSLKQQRNNNMIVNGSPSKGGRPAKRLKRSKSASSSSSLSSLSSLDHEQDPGTAPAATTNHVQGHRSHLTNAKTGRLGSEVFSNDQLNGEASEESNTRHRRLQPSFDGYSVEESNVRTASVTYAPDVTQSASFSSSALPSSRSQQALLRNGLHLPNKKEEYEDVDSPTSSAHGELLIPPPPGAQLSSRGGTPGHLIRPLKVLRKGARVKSSPTKKRAVVVAGIAHVGGGRDISLGHSGNADDHRDPNVDYCSACSGTGRLLCCDGCTRAFHFTCLDPPISENSDGDFYCYVCTWRRNPPPRHPRGVFGPLHDWLEKKNPTAFHLPYEIREYYEGVRTGSDGEYEETAKQKPSRSRTSHTESAIDTYAIKDEKNDKFILCYRCGESAAGRRQIIPCDFCSLHWHLDCLDPPLANPPPRGTTTSKTKHTWICPNHVDQELQALETSTMTSSKVLNGRSHKIRRPKHPRTVDIALRRGFKNNGNIEIENDPTDDEEFGIEREELGMTYRLPEKGIKLDFIDKCRRSWLDRDPRLDQEIALRALSEVATSLHPCPARLRSPARLPVIGSYPRSTSVPIEQRMLAWAAASDAREATENVAFQKAPPNLQEAALSLLQLASNSPEITLSSDALKGLVGNLIAGAPSYLMNRGSQKEANGGGDIEMSRDSPIPAPNQPRKLTEQQKKALRVMQDLIRRQLEETDV